MVNRVVPNYPGGIFDPEDRTLRNHEAIRSSPVDPTSTSYAGTVARYPADGWPNGTAATIETAVTPLGIVCCEDLIYIKLPLCRVRLQELPVHDPVHVRISHEEKALAFTVSTPQHKRRLHAPE